MELVSAMSDTMPKVKQAISLRGERIPAAGLLLSALERTYAASRLLHGAAGSCLTAFALLSAQLRKGLFMPFALTMISLVSRVHVLIVFNSKTLGHLYDALRTLCGWADTLQVRERPSPPHRGSQLLPPRLAAFQSLFLSPPSVFGCPLRLPALSVAPLVAPLPPASPVVLFVPVLTQPLTAAAGCCPTNVRLSYRLRGSL